MINKNEAKEWARAEMKGLWSSPMIPFTEDLQLDEAAIRSNTDAILARKVDGMGFGFSEPWVLSLEERKRGIEVFVEAARGKVPAYVHTTDHSVAETINLTRHAEASGADLVMIWVPYEHSKSEEMCVDFMEYVASKVDIGIIMYNTYHSGRNLSPEALARISKIRNICALKDAVNDFSHTVAVNRIAGKDMVVSNPLEDQLLPSLLYNQQQVLLGTTSVFLMQSPTYQPIRDYMVAAQQGRPGEAWQLYYQLEPLRQVWRDLYTTLWDKTNATHPVSLIKHWMSLVGMVGGPVRPPMPEASAEAKERFTKAVLDTGLMERLFPEKYAGAR